MANVVALLTQMFVMNDPTDEHFRYSVEAFVIYVMLVISFICNCYLAQSEYRSNFKVAHKKYLTGQNALDVLAIGYTFVYIFLRFIMPS